MEVKVDAGQIDVWGLIAAQPLDTLRQGLQPAIDDLLRKSAGPRLPAYGIDYLKRALPRGRIVLHGAGTHTSMLLDHPDALAGVEVVAISDRRPAASNFRGIPLVTIDALAALEFDHVVVGHLAFEAEMVEQLLSAGIPDRKLFRLYTSPTYAIPTCEALFQKITPELAGNRYLLVTDCGTEILPDTALTSFFDPAETAVLFLGDFYHIPTGRYGYHDLGQCVPLLLMILTALEPEAIFLRTFFDNRGISLMIREAKPSIPIVHEIWDMVIAFTESLLTTWNGWSNAYIDTIKTFERLSLARSQLVLSKRAGPIWADAMELVQANYAFLYPRIDRAAGTRCPNTCQTDRRRILYAGYLPVNPEEMGGTFDFISDLQDLAKLTDVDIDVYNANHRPETPAGRFQYYEAAAEASNGKIRYSPSIQYDELLSRIPSYDFGWLYARTPTTPNIDGIFMIPSRFSTYISAGLPVITTDEYTAIVDLIRRFEAGIVVKANDTRALPRQIQEADIEKLARGALRLRAHMIEHNDRVFDQVRAILRPAIL